LSAVPKRNTLRCTMHRRAQGRTRARGTTRERGTRRPHAASRGMFPRNRGILTGRLHEPIAHDTSSLMTRSFPSTPPLPRSSPPPSPFSSSLGRDASFSRFSDRFLAARDRSPGRQPGELKSGETRRERRDGLPRGGGGTNTADGGAPPEAPWRLKLFECCTISEAL